MDGGTSKSLATPPIGKRSQKPSTVPQKSVFRSIASAKDGTA